MRAATIRRSLVFGVCALGVGALYLVPSVGRSPYPVSLPTPNDEPSTQPTPPPTGGSASTGGRRTTPVKQPTKSPHAQPSTSATAEATYRPTVQASTSTPEPRPSSRGATPFHPDDGRDNEPPQPVQQITPTKVTAEQLSLNWPEAHDNVRVIGYHVWLSGFQVASTAETHATVRWFNDDVAQHVVQVRAVDAAGNEAPTSPTLLVSRPEPGETESPQPSDPPPTQPVVPPSPTASSSESTQVASTEPSAQSVAPSEPS